MSVKGTGTEGKVYLFASQSGRATLDQGEGGGNPFASSLIELLGRSSLSYQAFLTDLVELTERKSGGYQRPEIVFDNSPLLQDWNVVPRFDQEERVALVLVYSDYSRSDSLRSLPGAENDHHRVAAALERAGFATIKSLNPSPAEVKRLLGEFSTLSAGADVAVLYTTGHGVEIDDTVYLIPGGSSGDKAKLEKNGIRIRNLGVALKARRANLIFYGGCRTRLADR